MGLDIALTLNIVVCILNMVKINNVFCAMRAQRRAALTHPPRTLPYSLALLLSVPFLPFYFTDEKGAPRWCLDAACELLLIRVRGNRVSSFAVRTLILLFQSI